MLNKSHVFQSRNYYKNKYNVSIPVSRHLYSFQAFNQLLYWQIIILEKARNIIETIILNLLYTVYLFYSNLTVQMFHILNAFLFTKKKVHTNIVKAVIICYIATLFSS